MIPHDMLSLLLSLLFKYRFRKEASEERKEKMRDERKKNSSSPSPVERVVDIASSSVISALILVIVLVAATMTCLPILLLLRVSSMLFFPLNSSQDDVDSSIRPYSPPTDDLEASSFTERILFNFVGSPPYSCSSSERYEKECIATLLSNKTREFPLCLVHTVHQVMMYIVDT